MGSSDPPPGSAAQARHIGDRLGEERGGVEVEAEVLKEGCRVGKHRERGFQASSERSCSEYADISSSLPSPTSSSGRAAHTSTSSTPTASQIGHTGSDHTPGLSYFVFHFERTFVQ